MDSMLILLVAASLSSSVADNSTELTPEISSTRNVTSTSAKLEDTSPLEIRNTLDFEITSTTSNPISKTSSFTTDNAADTLASTPNETVPLPSTSSLLPDTHTIMLPPTETTTGTFLTPKLQMTSTLASRSTPKLQVTSTSGSRSSAKTTVVKKSEHVTLPTTEDSTSHIIPTSVSDFSTVNIPDTTGDATTQEIFTFSEAGTSSSVPTTSNYRFVTPKSEEVDEVNAIPTEEPEDKEVSIVVGRKCTRIFQDSILWNDTDGGILALKSCPAGYQGNMNRPCFSSGKWGNVDFSMCRLEHLGRMRHMIVHQIQKGMLGTMFKLVEEFAKYISSVDMKSPMDRLEAFEILNMFLKLDMNLKMDKNRDIKYIQTLLHACNDLIRKKTVLFPPGSQKNKLITDKTVEMIFDLTTFADRSLRGLLKTQKKQISFRSSPNVVLYLYRGKLSGQVTLMNYSSEYERELSSAFTLENTLERSAYALIWTKDLNDLLSTPSQVVNSDVATATILSPLDSLNHMVHSPTYDIGLRIQKAVPEKYTLKCGQLWNMSQLWDTNDCYKASVKDDIIVCRCHHLGSVALLLVEGTRNSFEPVPPVGKMITASCISTLFAVLITLGAIFVFKRVEQHLTIFILINLLVCMIAIQLLFMYGVNSTSRFEYCLSFALLLHYLFIVLCFWMVAYGINILQRLRTPSEYTGKIRDYAFFCWILPSILLVISFIGNPQGYETKQYCWLNVQHGIMWSFVFPVTSLILVNTIVMILAMKTFNEQMPATHRSAISRIKTSIRAGITLLPFFAINWFFGILAVENADNTALQFAFSVSNVVMGVMTMVFFCICDQNIQHGLRHKFSEVSKKPKVHAMRLRKSGSFPIMERGLMTLSEDSRRLDCTPLLAGRTPYHDTLEDPCCSNIRV